LEYKLRDGSYAIRSAGACGVFEEASSWDYREGAIDRYSADIVWADGRFVAYPEGPQQ